MERVVKNYLNDKRFGWGWSCTPTGEDAYSIRVTLAPDYEGTINQIQGDIQADKAFNNLGGAFYNTAWFYKGRRILKAWKWLLIEERTTPVYDEHGQHDWKNDDAKYGYGWGDFEDALADLAIEPESNLRLLLE